MSALGRVALATLTLLAGTPGGQTPVYMPYTWAYHYFGRMKEPGGIVVDSSVSMG